jgi:hypothetical protein
MQGIEHVRSSSDAVTVRVWHCVAFYEVLAMVVEITPPARVSTTIYTKMGV